MQTIDPDERLNSGSDAEDILLGLLTMEKLAVSEFELAMMAVRFADKHGLDIHRHLGHIDFGAFTEAEKHAFSFRLGLTPQKDPYIWNRCVYPNASTSCHTDLGLA